MDAKEVFLVQHVHTLQDGEEDVKIIGIYSTSQAAEEAVRRSRLLAGFCDASEGFTIDRYLLDQDGWAEGYQTVVGTGRCG